MIVPTTAGIQMHIDPLRDKGLEQALYYSGTYEAGTLHVMMHVLRAGDSFIDVGANVGLMTLFASRLVGASGRVYAFEPVPPTYQILESNLALNSVTNVRAEAIALGSASETRTIYERLDVNRGSATLASSEGDTERHEIRVEKLDDILARYAMAPVRAMKVDVEGWEIEVLRGAEGLLGSPDPPMLIVEHSLAHQAKHSTGHDLYALIRRVNDYSVFRLARGKESIGPLREVRRPDDLPRHDNLFCFPSKQRDVAESLI
jgi:FkbM family methyltransferase